MAVVATRRRTKRMAVAGLCALTLFMGGLATAQNASATEGSSRESSESSAESSESSKSAIESMIEALESLVDELTDLLGGDSEEESSETEDPEETVEVVEEESEESEEEETSATGSSNDTVVPADNREVFLGDWETGDTSQWGNCQTAFINDPCGEGSGYAISMTDDARQGDFAARFEIRDGDMVADGNRTEVQSDERGAGSKEGDEFWFEWSVKFDENFQMPQEGGWYIILQWHSDSGSPPIAVDVSPNGDLVVTQDGSNETGKILGTVRPGEWTDLVMHIKFSRDENVGFIEGWENGEQTLPLYNRATLRDGDNYLKQGIYRGRSGTSTDVVTMDGLRITEPA